jgi:hypothetical protein
MVSIAPQKNHRQNVLITPNKVSMPRQQHDAVFHLLNFCSGCTIEETEIVVTTNRQTPFGIMYDTETLSRFT